MKVRTRMMITILILGVLAFGFLFRYANFKLKPVLLQPMEDDLVDFAALLSAQLALDSQNGFLATERFAQMFESALRHPLQARIYDYEKNEVALEVYVTDANGVVQYDSSGRHVGQDFSGWIDVNRTLKGEYGARSTWVPGPDKRIMKFFVAAPVKVDGRILGVVSVGKPITLAYRFTDRIKQETIRGMGVAVTLAIIWGLLFSVWITRPISALTRYVEAVRDGMGGSLPKLGHSDIGVLGRSFEEMRDALEGKKYVEQYVQTLTHEIKSPLSAIKGAAELLSEDMPAERRTRFLSNILTESRRIQNIVDRLLELSAIESRKMPKNPREVDLMEVAADIIRSMGPVLEKRQLRAHLTGDPSFIVRGERFLLHLALSNLIQNAVEFSPKGSEIQISLAAGEVSIIDEGPGIPDYALPRVFDRFYSLSRPDTGKKSSGLGLSIVKRVAELHHSSVTLENHPNGGARAVWRW